MPQTVYTVGQLNRYIKNIFNGDYVLKNLTVKGEVSNCKYHSSGHIFFTLKDETGSVKCIMFAGNRGGLPFKMTDGMLVNVSGYVDVYVPDGAYQLYARSITKEGAGELYERFERLKEDLEDRGMFAEEYKQPIPGDAKCIGIVTASTGAAIRDIINVSKRRNPYIKLVLYPAIVQGPEAAPSIVKGIKALEKYGVDLMIVGRGGGSIEDLWAFNEEIVAQAIFDCSVPIISAVGHEIDFTIADFVADLRAATPSAAAEIAVSEISRIDEAIYSRKEELDGLMLDLLSEKRNRIEHQLRQLKLLDPEYKLRQSKERLARIEIALNDAIEGIIKSRKQRISLLSSRLDANSPLKRLESGYAFVTDEKGKRIKSVGQLKSGMKIDMALTDGYATALVDEIRENKNRK
ncbi:MAG: exodeoxyribonuclease VII large subunit [Lachnospiraceae bacterium]|nr:exodeoxyribonuclease VII large subunit [Lachnospiraceae bacterium]